LRRYSNFCDFLKMAAAAILDFQKLEIFTADPVYGVICVNVPNLIEIGQTVAEIWRFNFLLKITAVRHLGFLGSLLGPPATTT